MPERPKFTSHEQYIAAAPEGAREILLRIQSLVEAALPGAERCIGYNMPAYRLGKVFFYFAAFKNHLGIYPPLREHPALQHEIAAFSNEKGNLAFKYSAPIPYDLIVRVAVALAEEYARR